MTLAQSQASAAEQWLSLATPHFQMYTTNGEKQATKALQTFEQVRYFFVKVGGSRTIPDTPVRIVAFSSEKEFKPYRFNKGAFAYYQRGRKCDYIVMQDISSEQQLSTQPETGAEARSRLAALAKEYPDSPDVLESLGYLAWEAGDVNQARQYFENAVRDHSNDGEMIFQLAQLERAAGTPNAQVLPLFNQALKLKPTDAEVRLQFAIASIQERQFGSALSALSEIKTIKPDHAFTLFSAIAYCRFQLKDFDGAKTNALRAEEYAKDPDERNQIDNLLKALEVRNVTHQAPAVIESENLQSDQKPTIREAPIPQETNTWPKVHGTLKTFECTRSGPRLHIMVDSHEMVFEFTDPKSVIVRNVKDGFVDFSCGPLKPQEVTIVFGPAPAREKLDGEVRELIF